MMQPKSFLFGLITVPMYHYSCVMTNAQLELIASDKPVSYIKKKKEGKSEFNEPTAESIQDAIKRYKEKQNKKEV